MHDGTGPADATAGLPRTMGEYADRWLADLLDPLEPKGRRMIVQVLVMNWMGGPLPDRESVQRLIETHMGRISEQQYAAWMLSFATEHGEGFSDGIDHVLDRLAEGFEVGGSREKALWYLAGMDGTRRLLARVDAAVAAGVLTRTERALVLTHAFSYPPLPPLTPLPADVEPLPKSYPPSTPDYGAGALGPGTRVRGYATLAACREAAKVKAQMRSGELSRDGALRMLDALRTDFTLPE